MNCLRVLELLDEFHLEELHLHHLLLLLLDDAVLLFDLPGDLRSRLLQFPAAHFVLFLFSNLFVEFDSCLSFLIDSLHEFELMSFASLVLLGLDFGLLCLFMFAHEDGLLDLCFLHASLLAHLGDPVLRLVGDHIVIFHLLHLFCDADVIAFLKPHDFAGALLRFLDLLPGLHLLLLEECDTVSQELGISLDVLTLLFGDEMRLSLSAHSTWWVGLATSVRAELTSSVEVLSLVRHLKVVERLLAAVFSWESSVDLR